jgi:hypothetical protein
MALRFFGRSSQPAATPQSRNAPAAPAQPPAPRHDAFLPTDTMGLPEVEEKNSDSIWALWTDAVNEKEEPEQPAELLPNFLQTTKLEARPSADWSEDVQEPADGFPATQIMDLPEMLKGRE